MGLLKFLKSIVPLLIYRFSLIIHNFYFALFWVGSEFFINLIFVTGYQGFTLSCWWFIDSICGLTGTFKIVRVGGMPWPLMWRNSIPCVLRTSKQRSKRLDVLECIGPQTGATHYQVPLGLAYKGHVIKGSVNTKKSPRLFCLNFCVFVIRKKVHHIDRPFLWQVLKNFQTNPWEF